jgi:MoaA/NifB/PqqE/SkfB family radical SAM enzyme
VKGSWKRAIETYKKLKSLEKKYKNFKVFFGYTISPLNLSFFEQNLNDVKKLIPGIKANDFHVNLFQTSDVYYKNEDIFLDEKYFVDAINELDSILKLRGKPKDYLESIENKYLELGKKYLKTHKIPIKCNIFNLSCFIDPFGNVFPCTILNYSLGNLRENDYDLNKILSSDNAKKIKEKIVKGECPQCWTPCEAHQIILSNWLKT